MRVARTVIWSLGLVITIACFIPFIDLGDGGWQFGLLVTSPLGGMAACVGLYKRINLAQRVGFYLSFIIWALLAYNVAFAVPSQLGFLYMCTSAVAVALYFVSGMLIGKQKSE